MAGVSLDKSDVPIVHTIATTGLIQPDFDPEICQLALTKVDGQKLFGKYVLPERSFQKAASIVNGFEIGSDGKRCLMRHSKVMKTSPLCDVMYNFLDELSAIRAQVPGRIVLIGYNSKEYDMEVMRREMLRCGLSSEKISTMNIVCADLLQFVRNNRQSLLPFHAGDLKMTTVYNQLCRAHSKYKHDALEDAEKLRAIYCTIIDRVPKKKFEDCIFPFPVVAAIAKSDTVIQGQGACEPQQPRRSIKRENVEGHTPLDGPESKKARV